MRTVETNHPLQVVQRKSDPITQYTGARIEQAPHANIQTHSSAGANPRHLSPFDAVRIIWAPVGLLSDDVQVF